MRPFFYRQQCKRSHQLLILTLVVILCSVFAQAAPPAAVASTQTSLGFDWGGQIITDQAGDFYMIDAKNNAVFKIPAKAALTADKAAATAAKQTLLSNACGGQWMCTGFTLDAQGNVYYVDRWGGHTFKAARNVDGSLAPSTSFLTQIPNLGMWWYQVSSIATDGAGNFYIGQSQPANLYKVSQIANGQGNGLLLATAANDITSIALDNSGHVFYTDGSKAYMVPADASAPAVAIGTGLASPTGVYFDTKWNLYLTDTGNKQVVEVPFENGALNFANQFVVLAGTALKFGVVITPTGEVFALDGDGQLLRHSFNGTSVGGTAVGTPSAPTSIQYTFNAAVTPTFNFLIGGRTTAEFAADATSTCASGTAVTVGSSCTLNVTLNPATIGPRFGSVVVTDTAGTVLSQTSVVGVGQGAGLVIDPGTQNSIGTGFITPTSTTIDALGNLFIADVGLNAVKMIPAGGGTAVNVGTGLAAPASVALDGAGNVYIADTGNNRVVMVPLVDGAVSNAAQLTIASGLNSPTGITVNGLGVVYVANAGDGRVVTLAKSPLTNSYLVAPFATLNRPAALAVDGAGNLFVADAAANSVVEIPATGGNQITVATALATPSGVAVDAAGSVYIADSANQRVVMVPFVNGTFNSSALTQIGKALVNPQGVTVDAGGNVYIADAQLPGVLSVARTQGQVAFGKFNAGTSSGTLNASLYNIGNLPLTLSNPMYTVTGDATDFALGATSSTACDPANAVAPGSTCSLAVVFSPIAQGPRAAQVTLQSAALNASPIQLQLAGTGANLTATSTALTIASPATGNPVYGQTAQVMATVTPQAGAGTPTGTVLFSIDGNSQPDVTMTNGSVTISLLGLVGGSHIVTASYSGDTAFAASTAGAGLALTVDRAPSSATLTVAETTYPVTKDGAFTVAVTSSVTGIPSGDVTFKEGPTVLGTVKLDPTKNNTAILSTKSLAAGTHQIVAVYNGDANYASATSSSITVTITPAPDFDVAGGVSSLEVPRGGSGQFTLKVTPKFGMTDDLTFKCSGFADPAKTTCIFVVNSPKQPNATISGTATIQALADGTYPPVTVQVWAVGPTNASLHRGSSAIFFAFLLPGVGIVTLGSRSRLGRRGYMLLLMVVMAGLLALLAACGGTSLNTQNPLSSGANVSSSTVTLSVTSGGSTYAPIVVHQTTFTLTVK